jgi:hypothetical protein
MEIKFIRVVIFCLMLLAATLIFLVSTWDYLSGPEEKWIYYYPGDSEIILNEFSSYQLCENEMDKDKAQQASCRRIDGPYKLLNLIADYLL